MADEFPSRSLDKIVIRVPDGMRDRLAEEAKANGRSMNSEIVSRLEASFDAAGGPPDQNVFERYATEIARIAAQEAIDGMVQTFRRKGVELVEQKSGAWSEGFDEFERYGYAGRGRNPYPSGTQAHGDWDAGFVARMDRMERSL